MGNVRVTVDQLQKSVCAYGKPRDERVEEHTGYSVLTLLAGIYGLDRCGYSVLGAAAGIDCGVSAILSLSICEFRATDTGAQLLNHVRTKSIIRYIMEVRWSDGSPGLR